MILFVFWGAAPNPVKGLRPLKSFGQINEKQKFKKRFVFADKNRVFSAWIAENRT
jgi:hypothetical protein